LPPVHRLDQNSLSNGTTILNLSSPPSIHPTSQEFQHELSEQVAPPSPIKNQPNPSHTMVTRIKDNTFKKKKYPEFISLHASSESDPTTFLQANKFSHWRSAMADEINALAKNQTWTLVPLPNNQKVIGCK
jgi:hypothetical protein